MRRAALTPAVLGLAIPALALLPVKPKPVPQTTLLNLSCMSALAAVEQADLAGVFTFIAEKDSSAAFAELLVRNKRARKKYRAKLQADMKASGGVSAWDHEVLIRLLEIYVSPQAETLERLSSSMTADFNELSLAPALSLEEMNSRKTRRP